jgi:hypothetical protein
MVWSDSSLMWWTPLLNGSKLDADICMSHGAQRLSQMIDGFCLCDILFISTFMQRKKHFQPRYLSTLAIQNKAIFYFSTLNSTNIHITAVWDEFMDTCCYLNLNYIDNMHFNSKRWQLRKIQYESTNGWALDSQPQTTPRKDLRTKIE